MNFLDAKELQQHAMKARYGWRRFLMFGYVDADIKKQVHETIIRITNKDGEFDEHQARLDFVRAFPIED
jgi:hypothetical protein